MMPAAEGVTLEAILRARECRVAKQRHLIRLYATPLISFTVIMPGMFKDTPLSRGIFDEGLDVVSRTLAANGLTAAHHEAEYRLTGPEALWAVDCREVILKKMMVLIEETHPLGRLFDFDVIGRDMKPISREQLGEPARKCLLCGSAAHECCRSRGHALTDLIVKIAIIAGDYFKNGGDAWE